MQYLPHHLTDFLKSGLTRETLEKARYESVPEKIIEDGLDDLGRKKKKRLCSHWKIPITNPFNRQTYYDRKKLDEPIIQNKGKANEKEIYYVSPAKSAPHLYFSLQVDDWKKILDSNEPIFLTEGEKKADKLIQEGYYAVAISGVWCWSKDHYPIDDMDLICTNKRQIFITFDSDYRTKASVQSALTQLKLCIEEKGCMPIDCSVPPGRGKGVDDYIVMNGIEVWNNYVEEVKEKNKHRQSYDQLVEEAAWKYLKNPNMLDELIADIQRLGIVGEEKNLIRIYMACISYKQKSCIGLILKGASASGKTTLVKTITNLMPEGVVHSVTSQSQQALNYWTDIANKIITITEEKPPEDEFWEVASAWRQLIEDDHIVRVIVDLNEKDIDKRRKEIHVRGPIVYLSTTTQSKLHEENENRLLIFNTDDSGEHIRSIVEKVLEGDENEIDEEIEFIIAKHRKAVKLLKSIPYKKIKIPYRQKITFNSHSPEATRDSKKLIKLIRLSAFLHQFQRLTEPIVTTSEKIGDDSVSIKLQGDNQQNSSVVSVTPISTPHEDVCIYATLEDYNNVLKYFKDYFDANSSDIPKDLSDKWNKIYKFTGDDGTFTYNDGMKKWGLKITRVKAIVKDMLNHNMIVQVDKIDELFNQTQSKKNQFRCIAYDMVGSGLREIEWNGICAEDHSIVVEKEVIIDTHIPAPTKKKNDGDDGKNLQVPPNINEELTAATTFPEKSDGQLEVDDDRHLKEGGELADKNSSIENDDTDPLAYIKSFMKKAKEENDTKVENEK